MPHYYLLLRLQGTLIRGVVVVAAVPPPIQPVDLYLRQHRSVCYVTARQLYVNVYCVSIWLFTEASVYECQLNLYMCVFTSLSAYMFPCTSKRIRSSTGGHGGNDAESFVAVAAAMKDAK